MVDFRKVHTEHPPLSIDGAAVERVSSTKFLGVHISEDLSWTTNCSTGKESPATPLLPPQAQERKSPHTHPELILLGTCRRHSWSRPGKAVGRRTRRDGASPNELRRSLGEDGPDSGIGGVHPDHEGAAGVRMGEDGGRGKALF